MHRPPVMTPEGFSLKENDMYASDAYTKEMRQEKARIMREFAKHELAQGLSMWKEESMQRMVRDDAKQYREIAKHIKSGELDEARRLASGMDTVARERIPDSVWYWLMKEAD
jgi:hypothetical protein